MIKIYNQYIKESLLDKIEGPSKEDVFSTYKQLLNNNKISIDEYISKLKKIEINQDVINKNLDDYLIKLNPTDSLFVFIKISDI